MTDSARPLAPMLLRVLMVSAGLAALLAGLGLLVFTTALADWQHALLGLAAVLLVLAGYAGLGGWGIPRIERLDARLLRVGLAFGLAAAIVYTAEVVLEYIVLPSDNTNWGLVEFGLVFLCYLLAGLWAGRQTGRARYGMVAAASAALVSTLVWYIVVLASTYVMHGTPQQEAVFRAEGNYDDFARSGATNFQAWMLEDFFGAGFYHLLLGPIVAALLGGLGGLAGKRLASHGTSRPARTSP